MAYNRFEDLQNSGGPRTALSGDKDAAYFGEKERAEKFMKRLLVELPANHPLHKK